MGTFAFLLIGIWAIAMVAWYMVSKYVRSADVDKVKSRLLGTAAKAKKGSKKEDGKPTTVLQTSTGGQNKFANMLVEKYQLGPKLLELLEQAGLKWAPARLVHLSIMAAGGGFAISWLFFSLPIWAAIGVGLVIGSGPLFFVLRKRKARLHRFEEIFPDTLEFVSRSMRAGHAFSVSLEMIHREFQEPVAGEFKRTFEEHNLGLPLETALLKLAKRVPLLDVHFFVSAVLLQKRTGGNLAEILDKLAYVIRERFKLRGRIRAVSAHGKMTATALSSIPAAVAVLMFYTNPDYVKFFFYDEVGQMMMGTAVALQIVGYLVMKQIVNIEV
jgi:tight adherence protein B